MDDREGQNQSEVGGRLEGGGAGVDRVPTAGAVDGEAEAVEQALRALVERLNWSHQRNYGRVTLWVLLGWFGAVALMLWAQGWTLWALLGAIGLVLLGLFVLRTVVGLLGRPLARDLDHFLGMQKMSLAEALERARTFEPRPDFFLSLIDGPWARAQRERRR